MKYKFVVFTMALSLFLFSCATKESSTEAENDEWPELDAFHMTMAEAFHPLKDSGNVEPAIRLMGQLADDAEMWAAAPLPEKVNSAEMKEKIGKLHADLRALSDEVNDGADEDQIGTTLFTIHDQFHEIMEAWHKGGDNHEHEHQEKL
ncbi:MAG: hypothetical protein JJE09_04345 [Bacteroidia bacterium]|nr:hypothetical protein [Bacteroidia bacterium]